MIFRSRDPATRKPKRTYCLPTHNQPGMRSFITNVSRFPPFLLPHLLRSASLDTALSFRITNGPSFDFLYAAASFIGRPSDLLVRRRILRRPLSFF